MLTNDNLYAIIRLQTNRSSEVWALHPYSMHPAWTVAFKERNENFAVGQYTMAVMPNSIRKGGRYDTWNIYYLLRYSGIHAVTDIQPSPAMAAISFFNVVVNPAIVGLYCHVFCL